MLFRRRRNHRSHRRLVLSLALLFLLCGIQFNLIGLPWVQVWSSLPYMVATTTTLSNKPNRQTPSQQRQVLQQQICSRIPNGVSASRLWKQALPIIEQGLRHPLDESFLHQPWTHQLLQLLSAPHRLQASIRGQPSWQLVFPILVKLANHLQNPRSFPPLKIVVMGGSVAEGVQCERPPPSSSSSSLSTSTSEIPYRSLQDCAWPFRLNTLLDHVFQTYWKVPSSSSSSSPVQIFNIATGGTTTAAATPVVEYWLNEHFQSSASAHGSPLDMIISGYAVNDNLPSIWWRTDHVNTTASNFHFLNGLSSGIHFVQAVANMHQPPSPPPPHHHSHENDNAHDPHSHDPLGHHHYHHQHPHCHRGIGHPPDPLVLFLNDYFGNQQPSILGDGQRDEAIQWLSDLQDHVGYVSPPHASLHSWVWADTDEALFSGQWNDPRGKEQVDAHYGTAGHVTTAVFLAYYLLQLAVDVCDQVVWRTEEDDVVSFVQDMETYTNRHDPSEFLELQVPSSLHVMADDIDSLSIAIEETSWNQDATITTMIESTTSSSSMCGNVTGMMFPQDPPFGRPPPPPPPPPHHPTDALVPPCTFGFLAARMGSHKTIEDLATYLEPFTLVQQGWKVENNFRHGGHQNKMGLVAKEPDATMVLTTLGVIPVQLPIRFLTVYYLKSYGPLWKNSEARFEVQVFGPRPSRRRAKPVLLHRESFHLEGYHDQEFSINYVFKKELDVPVPVGGSMQWTMTLVNGRQFKINAIMWCSK